MDNTCLFCRIISDPGQAAVVLDDPAGIAFLDHRPVFEGHCLLVPRKHFVTLADMPASQVGPLFKLARRLATAVQQAMEADGSLVLLNNTVSQSVPHLHIHVVPRRFKDGLRGFLWPRRRYAGVEAMEAVRMKINDAINAGS